MKATIKLTDSKYCGYFTDRNHCPLLDRDSRSSNLKHICKLGYKLEDRYLNGNTWPERVLRPIECIKENGK